ncbi:MAG: ester cyclase [Acidobacteria bacterium]|nr:ester cyclase [Acidobacteriota bacterium]
MTLEANKALARVWFDEIMNKRDLGAIDRAYAPDYVHRGPDGHELRGLDELRRMAERLFIGIPDRQSTVEQPVAEDDIVVTRWMSRGTHSGPLLGRPPTGEQITARGLVMTRIADGKIVEDWEMVEIVTEAS